jgi:LigD-like primase-polymerase
MTKGQMLDYHARIAPTLLPHLRGRPVTLRRFPDGVGGITWHGASRRRGGRWSGLRPRSRPAGDRAARLRADRPPPPRARAARDASRRRRDEGFRTGPRAHPRDRAAGGGHRRDAEVRPGGKVYVDWLQNDATRQTVAPYSLRGLPVPTVATPVTWDEVERAVDEDDPGGADVPAGRRARARRPPRRSLRAGSRAPAAIAEARERVGAYGAGLMFWLTWKTLSGSYFALISARRA